MSMTVFIIASALGALLALIMIQLHDIKKIHPNTKLLVDAFERLAMHSKWPEEYRK